MIDIAKALAHAPAADALARTSIQNRAAAVLRPPGALGRLDDIAVWLAGWQRNDTPTVSSPTLLIAVADHGVAVRDVSAFPTHVTRAMLDALRAGVATSTVLAESVGATVRVIDVGVGRPTADIVVADAMTPDGFEEAFDIGRQSVGSMKADLLLVGEMGIGNTTAAAAVALTLFGGEADDWVGPGTGVEDGVLKRKIEVVQAASDRVGPTEPMEVLRRLGGFEMTALAGAVFEARLRSIPVLLDGFVTTAAVAPLQILCSDALDHTMAAHRSSEPGHGRLLQQLGLVPLLELDLRLGEGSGALIALPIVRAATVGVTDVATFDEWGLR